MNSAKLRNCSRCKTDHPLTNFSKGKSDGLHVWCKPCLSTYAKSIKERKGPNFYREQSYQRKYGLSISQVEQMLKDQGGGCALCDSTLTFSPGFSKSAHVDHCHSTGKVRGILCGNCNTALGKLGDTPKAIQRALDYLEKS